MMSTPMKAPRAKQMIKVIIEGKRTSLYLIPKDKADGLEKLLSEYRSDDLAPAEAALKNLRDNHGAAGSPASR